MSSVSIVAYEDNQLHLADRIVSTRVEFSLLDSVVARFDYSSVRLLGSNSALLMQQGQNAIVGALEEHLKTVMPFFVVERRKKKGEEEIIARYYTIDQQAISYLSSQVDEGLVEDGQLLGLALSMLSPHCGVDPLQFYMQRIRPLESENAILRQALGLAKDEPFRDVDVLKRKGKPQRNATLGGSTTSVSNIQSQRCQVSAPTVPVTVDQATQTDPKTALQSATPADAFSVHSPLQWEQETDAAINARTKYEPFRSHSPSNHKLDLFTQQHLVVRLHDQSVDMLRARRTGGGSPTPNDDTERRTLTADEQRDLGERLHDTQQKHTAKVLEELSALYKPNTSSRTVMTSEEIKASNERIYNQPMERKKTNMEKLLQKYVFDEEEKLSKVKLSLERQKAMADRLSKK